MPNISKENKYPLSLNCACACVAQTLLNQHFQLIANEIAFLSIFISLTYVSVTRSYLSTRVNYRKYQCLHEKNKNMRK